MSSNKISKKFNCRSNLMIVLFKWLSKLQKKDLTTKLGDDDIWQSRDRPNATQLTQQELASVMQID